MLHCSNTTVFNPSSSKDCLTDWFNKWHFPSNPHLGYFTETAEKKNILRNRWKLSLLGDNETLLVIFIVYILFSYLHYSEACVYLPILNKNMKTYMVNWSFQCSSRKKFPSWGRVEFQDFWPQYCEVLQMYPLTAFSHIWREEKKKAKLNLK